MMEGNTDCSEVSGSGTNPVVTPLDQPCTRLLYTRIFCLSLHGVYLFIVLMAGLVFIIIKTMRRLREPHNIWVANFMVYNSGTHYSVLILQAV